MKVIHKYQIYPGYVELHIPEGAIFLDVQSQWRITTGYNIVVWALIDTDKEALPKQFIIVGTGVTFPEGDLNYIGTVQVEDYVWHVFWKELD